MRTALLALLCMASCPVLHANQFKPTPRQTYEIFNQLFLEELAVDPKKNPDFREINNIKEELEIEMGVRTNDKDRTLLREPTAEDLRKLKGFWRDRSKDYKQAEAKYNEHHDQAAKHYDKAISLTVKYYQLEPPQVSGTVINGPSVVRGNRLDWRPRFVAKPPKHLKGRDIDGMTSADSNSIEIYPGAVLYPGLLAATLRHEGSSPKPVSLPNGTQRIMGSPAMTPWTS
ncbi:MAG: hypothetical protein HZB91_00200 [Elusimicrobia bacterium]|nr:hypothetical protein [Elusimicrobiota bacterium]